MAVDDYICVYIQKIKMKKLLTLLAALPFLILTGCFEIKEEVTINPDGSGFFTTSADMGEAIGMIMAMAQNAGGENGGLQMGGKDINLDKVIDTTIQFGMVLDSAKDVSPEERMLFKNATMGIKMNMKESVMKMTGRFPFANFADYEKIRLSMKKIQGQLKDKSPLGGAMPGGGGEGNPLDQFSGLFVSTASDGKLTRTMDKAKMAELTSGKEMKELGEAKAMLEGIKFTTVIHLPRPAKSLGNKNAVVSEDRKKVTITYNLIEMMETPESAAYNIEY